MLRIKKLDIFIAKQFALLFVGTFFICQFVLMMQFLWRYIDELIGKGLSMDIMAQFFWYMGIMLVPQALPLAILLSALITFGNLGESSELTAIKAAGISLMQAFKPLIYITVFISIASFYFQNNIGPQANMKMAQLLISMKQKSPELEIPEGIFYDGIPNCNLYVQKKNLDTGMLYGIMIYRMNGSYEDQQIILADSGMLQSTAEKKHIVLTLWSGEWFENMQAQELAGNASVPYRRETFIAKKIVIPFDGGFNMTDASSLSNNARAKSLKKISHDMDSLVIYYDSVGRSFYTTSVEMYYPLKKVSAKDSVIVAQRANEPQHNVDSAFSKLRDADKVRVVNFAKSRIQSAMSDYNFKSMMMEDADRTIRQHQIEAFNKFTLALSCIIFFFIGAPLGAIIRKGGLGFPVLISVIVFIIFYILDNTGYRMSRIGEWTVWFGKSLATVVLTPIAIFVTYKANNDSVVFNIDAYRDLLMRLLGLRTKRHIAGKEVIIDDPQYLADASRLEAVSAAVERYSSEHRLLRWPNPVKVFFRPGDDHDIEHINADLEAVIEDLSNSRDRFVIMKLNEYPVIATHAHTRPFRRKWLNVLTGLFLPTGLFFYFRMLRFRFRLYKDLQHILRTNAGLVPRLTELGNVRGGREESLL